MATEKETFEKLISMVESYTETWKQLHHYISLAKTKKFDEEDENEFLEIKSVITQELELIMATVEIDSPSRADVHDLIGKIPTLQSLSEQNENFIKGIDTQWHRNFVALQILQGMVKAQIREMEKKKGKDEGDFRPVLDRVESYVETWKQILHYLNTAGGGKFDEEDETEFLEIKSVALQELELIYSMMEFESPSKAEIIDILTNAVSLTALSQQNENAQRTLGDKWHKVFIGFQALAGAIKAQIKLADKKSAEPAMEERVAQMENYVETWKQFNHFLGLAKSGKFDEEDETQFLETKSVIVQEMESICAVSELTSPTREDVHAIVIGAISLARLGDAKGGAALKTTESKWHQIFIGFQAVLGQLKVQLQESGKKKGWSLFGWGKK